MRLNFLIYKIEFVNIAEILLLVFLTIILLIIIFHLNPVFSLILVFWILWFLIALLVWVVIKVHLSTIYDYETLCYSNHFVKISRKFTKRELVFIWFEQKRENPKIYWFNDTIQYEIMDLVWSETRTPEQLRAICKILISYPDPGYNYWKYKPKFDDS